MSNKKTNKESVRLRSRTLKNGTQSLYLDIYRDGRREYEYLKIYLSPGNSKEDKAKNKEKLEFAEAVLAKRIVELRNGEFGFRSRSRDILFYDYYVALCKRKKGIVISREGRGTKGNWQSALKHMEIYDPHLPYLRLADVTNKWVQGFKDYLVNDAQAWSTDYRREIAEHKLRQSTAKHYLVKLMSCIKNAIEEGLMPPDTLHGITGIKPNENERDFLTIEELQKLIVTPCRSELVRRAFLFSCLTGLRRSDIRNLKWGQVYKQGEFTRVVFTQQKTENKEYLDLTPQALEYMGERGKDDDNVFPGLYSPTTTNRIIYEWCRDAGINKRITLHCGRHTFATMMLSIGTDLYTVSKLLGHRDITSTQIYARVIDKNKQAAVLNIPSLKKNEEK